jgi:hypothetical protein
MPLPEDAHVDWINFARTEEDRKYLWHAVVRVPEGVIDLTGSQYGSSFGGVRYLTFEELKEEWTSFKTHPQYPEKVKEIDPDELV